MQVLQFQDVCTAAATQDSARIFIDSLCLCPQGPVTALMVIPITAAQTQWLEGCHYVCSSQSQVYGVTTSSTNSDKALSVGGGQAGGAATPTPQHHAAHSPALRPAKVTC